MKKLTQALKHLAEAVKAEDPTSKNFWIGKAVGDISDYLETKLKKTKDL